MSTITPKLLSATAYLPLYATTPIFTSCNGNSSFYDVIRHIHIANPTGSPATFSLFVSNNAVVTYSGISQCDAVCYDATDGLVWYADGSANTVGAVNATTGALVYSGISTGSSPVDICYDSGSGTVWTANYGGSTVTKINATTGVAVGSYTTGTSTAPMSICSDGTYVWTANHTGTVSKIQISNGAAYSGSPYTVMGGTPSYLSICWDGTSIWMTGGSAQNKVYQITQATGAVANNYTTGLAGGSEPMSICYDSIDGYLWIACVGAVSNPDQVVVMNKSGVTQASKGSPITVPLGFGVGTPRAINFDGSNIWCATSNADGSNTATGVCKLSLSNGAILATYNNWGVPANPVAAAIASGGGNIWVAVSSASGGIQMAIDQNTTAIYNTQTIAANSTLDWYGMLRLDKQTYGYNQLFGQCQTGASTLTITVGGARGIVE